MKTMLLGISISLLGITTLVMNIPGLISGTYPFIIVAVGLVFSIVGFLVPDKEKDTDKDKGKGKE